MIHILYVVVSIDHLKTPALSSYSTSLFRLQDHDICNGHAFKKCMLCHCPKSHILHRDPLSIGLYQVPHRLRQLLIDTLSAFWRISYSPRVVAKRVGRLLTISRSPLVTLPLLSNDSFSFVLRPPTSTSSDLRPAIEYAASSLHASTYHGNWSRRPVA